MEHIISFSTQIGLDHFRLIDIKAHIIAFTRNGILNRHALIEIDIYGRLGTSKNLNVVQHQVITILIVLRVSTCAIATI